MGLKKTGGNGPSGDILPSSQSHGNFRRLGTEGPMTRGFVSKHGIIWQAGSTPNITTSSCVYPHDSKLMDRSTKRS